MSYNTYQPDLIDSMFFHNYHIKNYVFGNNFSLYEEIGQALEHVNEVIKEVNDVGEALVLFEQYVLSQLTQYDQKIIDDVTLILNQYITDGTIADLINQTLFGNITTSIINLTNTVNNNKTSTDGLIETNKNEANNKFSEIDQAILDLNYKQGSSIMSIAPSQLIYNNGETINGIMLNLNINNGTDNITSIKYYKNNVLVNTKSTNILLDENYLDGNIITSNVEYYVELSDGKTSFQSNKVNIEFIDNFYSGLIENNEVVTENLIKSLTGIKEHKSDKIQTYSPNNQKILFAYPSYYGNLSSIVDSENYDMIDGFTKSVINLTLNSVQVPYNVYVTNNFIFDNNIVLNFEF